MSLPDSWMPPASMKRVICHWTAGSHKASATDREHYHVLFEADGNPVRGEHPISANEANLKPGEYAAHTLNSNTGSIGVSLCCMYGAVESPFSVGQYPMTRAQWTAMVAAVAQLCQRYGIEVSPETVLSHAEVQGTLGIKQRGKWDFTRLAFDPTVIGATACGDKLRTDVLAAMVGEVPDKQPDLDAEEGAAARQVGVITASSLNLRAGPAASERDIGDMPKGLNVEILDTAGAWSKVRTPFGAVGWAASRYIATGDSSPADLFSTKAPWIIAALIADIPAWGLEDAIAVLGNIGHECDGFEAMQEKAPRGGRGGYGWPQWTGARRVAFESWCAKAGLDPGSDEANYGFLIHELRTTEKRSVAATAKASSRADKVRAFEQSFERAGVKHYESRERWADKAADAWAAATADQKIPPFRKEPGAMPAEPKPLSPIDQTNKANKGAMGGLAGGGIGGAIIYLWSLTGAFPKEWASDPQAMVALTAVGTALFGAVTSWFGAYRAPDKRFMD